MRAEWAGQYAVTMCSLFSRCIDSGVPNATLPVFYLLVY